MSKRELIDRIIIHNRTALPEFLAEFGPDDLAAYLRQLEAVDEHHEPVTGETQADCSVAVPA